MTDYLDSYKNLSYKSLSALFWIDKFCANAQNIVKIDDDVIVNPFILSSYLDLRKQRKKESSLQQRKVSNFSHTERGRNTGDTGSMESSMNQNMAVGSSSLKVHASELPIKKTKEDWHGVKYPGSVECIVWSNMVVIRTKTSRWYVSETEFKAKNYPKYCSGNAFILDTASAKDFVDASLRVPFLWVDDVFITGVLVKEIGLELKDISSLYELSWEKFHLNLLGGERMFMHNPSKDRSSIEKMWKLILKKEETSLRNYLTRYNDEYKCKNI